MGKTVPSYRWALEDEINSWRGYENALRKDDREAFSELMDMCRVFAAESGNATRPDIFEPMVMSILLFQQKRLNQLEKTLGIKSPFGVPQPPKYNDDKRLETQ